MIEMTDGATHTHIYTNIGDEGEIDISNSDCRDFFQELVHHLLYGKEMPLTQEEELHPLRVVIRAFEVAEVIECEPSDENMISCKEMRRLNGIKK